MSQWLDQIKLNMSGQLSKIYKDAKQKASPEDYREFESWFWKIRPHISVDTSKYQPGSRVKDENINSIVPTSGGV
jgi:hypothetical protein